MLTISGHTMRSLAYVLVRPELAEDPNDWLADHLLVWVFHLSTDSKVFAIAYLLVHGIIKLVIVVAIPAQSSAPACSWSRFWSSTTNCRAVTTKTSWRIGGTFGLFCCCSRSV